MRSGRNCELAIDPHDVIAAAFLALTRLNGMGDIDSARALRVLAGQIEAAKSAGEEALPLLEARLRDRPDDTFAMTELAWVYLVLGGNADALRLAREAAASIPIEKDAVSSPTFQNGLAQIEAACRRPRRSC